MGRTYVSVERASLMRLIRMLKRKKMFSKGIVITPSSLRVDQKLENSKTLYIFDIQENTNSLPTEQKLNINDAFYCTHMGLFLYSWLTTGVNNYALQTYPNTTVFVANAGFVPQDLEAVYQGKIDVKVQSKVMIEKLDTFRFRQVPQTQQTAVTNKSQRDEFQGYSEMTPELFLKGRASNEISLTIPTQGAIQWEQTIADTDNYVSWLVRGFLTKNINFLNVR